MIPQVTLLEDRKGSNPGGLVIVSNSRDSFKAYLKYCPGSKIPKDCGFNPQNQPIYEAITFEMARSLGLLTPDFYVLLNSDHNLRIVSKPGVKEVIDPRRKCYFVSRFVESHQLEDEDKLNKQIAEDSVYRDLLRIKDIVGKRQNFLFLENERIQYIDLGCSFVHAVEGYLLAKNSELKALSSSEKELKSALDHLRRYHLITRDEKEIISLTDLVKMPLYLKIPVLGDSKKLTLDSLISQEEIHNIIKIMAIAAVDHLKQIKSSGNIIHE